MTRRSINRRDFRQRRKSTRGSEAGSVCTEVSTAETCFMTHATSRAERRRIMVYIRGFACLRRGRQAPLKPLSAILRFEYTSEMKWMLRLFCVPGLKDSIKPRGFDRRCPLLVPAITTPFKTRS